jgi:hypothetical protein
MARIKFTKEQPSVFNHPGVVDYKLVRDVEWPPKNYKTSYSWPFGSMEIDDVVSFDVPNQAIRRKAKSALISIKKRHEGKKFEHKIISVDGGYNFRMLVKRVS